jgi:hypothetical protein
MVKKKRNTVNQQVTANNNEASILLFLQEANGRSIDVE